MKLAMGMLCYSRPVHTALTLAFLFANKSGDTDVHFFYGISEEGEHKSPALLGMLRELDKAGYGVLHYLPDDYEKNTGGNLDNLMLTLGMLTGYGCYFKIDDDVLIGKHSDEQLAELLLSKELKKSKAYILTGQAVREHMREPDAFGWDVKIDPWTVVTRSRGRSPMETYAAISYKMLPFLKANKLKLTCGNSAGTFGGFSIKLHKHGAKAALVLYPSIVMQHIGLTCTTGLRPGNAHRSWAPATHWSPAGRVIEIPEFDFRVWERSHLEGTQKVVALNTLYGLRKGDSTSAIGIIISALEKYEPGVNDVDLPIGRPVVDSIHHRKRKARRTKRRVVVTPGGR